MQPKLTGSPILRWPPATHTPSAANGQSLNSRGGPPAPALRPTTNLAAKMAAAMEIEAWLTNKEAEQRKTYFGSATTEVVEKSWVMVFNFRKDANGKVRRDHMEEAQTLCQAMWRVNLRISHKASPDNKRLFISVGAPNWVLEEEATVCGLMSASPGGG